jgi:hypothetical protein
LAATRRTVGFFFAVTFFLAETVFFRSAGFFADAFLRGVLDFAFFLAAMFTLRQVVSVDMEQAPINLNTAVHNRRGAKTLR